MTPWRLCSTRRRRRRTLGAWCEDWAARGDGVAMGADEVAKWRRYGELVYEEDAPFETYT